MERQMSERMGDDENSSLLLLTSSMRSEIEEHSDVKRWSNEWHKVLSMILNDIK